MKFVNQSYDIVHFDPESDVRRITMGYCICYKTPLPDGFDKQCAFIKKHLKHESPLEHSSLTVHFVTNRGIAYELIRHRHVPYDEGNFVIDPGLSQESTRYCNYANERFDGQLTYIRNSAFYNELHIPEWEWIRSKEREERLYNDAIAAGHSPSEARGYLSHDLKTELIFTANYREWRHIFELRCDKHAHYQMRELMVPLKNELADKLPCVFDI